MPGSGLISLYRHFCRSITFDSDLVTPDFNFCRANIKLGSLFASGPGMRGGCDFLGSPLPGNLMLTDEHQEIIALGQETVRHINHPQPACFFFSLQIQQTTWKSLMSERQRQREGFHAFEREQATCFRYLCKRYLSPITNLFSHILQWNSQLELICLYVVQLFLLYNDDWFLVLPDTRTRTRTMKCTITCRQCIFKALKYNYKCLNWETVFVRSCVI